MKKNAKELHHEHKRWTSELETMASEFISLARHYPTEEFQHDIGSLLNVCVSLKFAVQKHEGKLALAFKAAGIEDYDDIFEDHEDMREKIESLRFKLDSLKALLSKREIIYH